MKINNLNNKYKIIYNKFKKLNKLFFNNSNNISSKYNKLINLNKKYKI